MNATAAAGISPRPACRSVRVRPRWPILAPPNPNSRHDMQQGATTPGNTTGCHREQGPQVVDEVGLHRRRMAAAR